MIRTKTAQILLVFVFSLFGLKLSLGQQPSECMAVITEISGAVFIKKINKNEFLKAFWGMPLFQGDQVKTSDNSKVSLLYANSNLIKLDANSLITVAGNESTEAAQPTGTSKKYILSYNG